MSSERRNRGLTVQQPVVGSVRLGMALMMRDVCTPQFVLGYVTPCRRTWLRVASCAASWLRKLGGAPGSPARFSRISKATSMRSCREHSDRQSALDLESDALLRGSLDAW